MLHFRTPEITLACLHSLHDEGIRFVVLVDNSEDAGRSLTSMRPQLAALREAGLQVKIVEPERNLGFAAGVAAGIECLPDASPSHVLLINSDAQLAPHAMYHLREGLKQGGVAVPRLRSPRGEPLLAFAYYDRCAALITQKPVFAPVRYPSGCCLLIHANQVRPDLFDNDFFFYGDDVMYGFDLARRGVPTVDCPDAVVEHAVSVSARNSSLFYEYHMNRSHWLLARKLSRNSLEYGVFIVVRCLVLPLRAALRSLRKRSLIPWYGLFAATSDVLHGRCRSFTPPAQ
ncbi:MAG: glycosyltransferase family 2 protein [Gammaproteobacteria bacterium]